MERKTLTILQACAEAQVSRRTIYNWINAGKVEYVRTAGGAVRIFADSLWRDRVGKRSGDAQDDASDLRRIGDGGDVERLCSQG